MKLWKKNSDPLSEVEKFTVGADRELDMKLAAFDALGSLAHIQMLESIGLLTNDEFKKLRVELVDVYKRIESGNFTIEDGIEDIHSQVELELTKKLGDVGKKIHSGRSRNDQVLVDIKLYLRHEIEEIVRETVLLFDLFIELSEKHKDHLLPGYTHLQLAMPSSFGLWFGAYAESLVDDLTTLEAAFKVVNRNPLGSAAGYGSSFPLNRQMTTELLGFDSMNYNVVYAQMGRGKTERIVAQAVSNIGSTLNKLAIDACLFLNQQFGFISFPDQLTTGSSIMPHKKNPDVFEIIRGRTNQLMSLSNEINLLVTNLPSGYHRDFQLLKEILFPAFKNLKDCLQMTHLMLSNISVKENLLEDDKYRYLFSVEEVNKLVLAGVPFRDAYKQVGLDIESGEYDPDKSISHTHAGSIGNLCNDEIQNLMKSVVSKFEFERVNRTVASLLA